MIGAVYLDRGLEAAAALVHRLVDPLIDAAADLGAGLDWKTSLQEMTAGLGLGVPEYVVTETGPDHEKTFAADVRVAARGLRLRAGSEQEGSRAGSRSAAWTALRERSAPPRGRRRGSGSPDADSGAEPLSRRAPPMPELPEVEVVRRGLDRFVSGRTVSDVEVLHPRAVRRHAAGASDLVGQVVGRRVAARVAARQVPLAAARREAARPALVGTSA